MAYSGTDPTASNKYRTRVVTASGWIWSAAASISTTLERFDRSFRCSHPPGFLEKLPHLCGRGRAQVDANRSRDSSLPPDDWLVRRCIFRKQCLDFGWFNEDPKVLPAGRDRGKDLAANPERCGFEVW